MKFLLLLILISTTTFGQTKKNTSIIVNGITNKEVLIQALIASENYIATEPNWSYQYHYQVILKEDRAIIKPYWTSGIGLNLNGITADAQLNKWHWHKNKKSNINGIIANETITMLKNAGYSNIIFK